MRRTIASTMLIYCESCDKEIKTLWIYDKPLTCPSCDAHAVPAETIKFGEAPGIACDDIPGGVEIRHGICNEDGTPKRYYSKTDMKRAANEAGLVWDGDTPKPYSVPWSGIRKNKNETTS